MHNLKISLITIFSSALLFFIHKNALINHWYVQYWFLDIFMHFLGGVCIALLLYCIAIFFNFNYIKYSFWNLIIYTFIIGFAWELFEYIYDITGSPIETMKYKVDTIKDLIMDTLGAVFVFLFIKNKK